MEFYLIVDGESVGTVLVPDALEFDLERIVGGSSGVVIDAYRDVTLGPVSVEHLIRELNDGLGRRTDELSDEIVSDGKPLRPWENDWLNMKVETDALCSLLRELIELLETGIEVGGQIGWFGD